MADSTIWWGLAGMAVVAELLTGTFYLLMVALGLAGGALAAHLGLSPTTQLVCAAVLGAGAVVVLYRIRPKPQPLLAPRANADVNMDVGQTLTVEAWNGYLAKATYRGAIWSVELLDTHSHPQPPPGLYRIREVVGSVLRVEPA